MKRVVHLAKSFEKAEEWDKKQLRSMTLKERHEVVKFLRRRVYGEHPKGIRECHQK